MQILRSPSVKPYGMLNPRAPNFLLSRVTPWKTQREKRRRLNSSTYIMILIGVVRVWLDDVIFNSTFVIVFV